MGSRVGYEYRYRLWMVDEDEINSKYKLKLKAGTKSFLFEFRTNFILKRRSEEEGEGISDAIIIDSERFDARLHEHDDPYSLFMVAGYRLREYWMTEDEILSLQVEAFDFAKQMGAHPQHASLRLIPVVVGLHVCTMQQEGESYGAWMNRAIKANNLVPLYLWPHPTVERKLRAPLLVSFLAELPRIRVEDIDQGLALMQICSICLRNTTIGAQISLLPCAHAFHSHCIVRWLEDSNLCPSCHSPAYNRCIARFLPCPKTNF